MNRRAWPMMMAGLSTICGLFFGGCSSEPSAVGTNTSWLRSCSETSQCDQDLACLCSRCTQACDTDADCPDELSCSSSSSSKLQCDGEPTRTCQPACSTSTDCEENRVCYQGSCTDPTPALQCPPDAFFCHDFENELTTATAVVTEGNQLSQVEATTPSGNSALEATITEAPSVSYYRADVPALNSGEVFLSAWVKIPEEVEHDVAPLGLWASGEEDWALRIVIRNRRAEIWTHTDAHAGPSDELAPGWHCLQMNVVIGEGSDGSVGLSVDDLPSLEADGIDTLPLGGIEALAIGSFWAGTSTVVQVDRVIVGPTASTCYDS